jgi:hypothetical protein
MFEVGLPPLPRLPWQFGPCGVQRGGCDVELSPFQQGVIGVGEPPGDTPSFFPDEKTAPDIMTLARSTQKTWALVIGYNYVPACMFCQFN